MIKSKTVYICRNCGAKSPKWLGKCSTCDEWNTYDEEVLRSGRSTDRLISVSSGVAPKILNDIESIRENRLDLKSIELNRVLGGGLVEGSVVLIGGEPGIGKSTLLLQVALINSKYKILYVSGEESLTQIKLRADRIGTQNNNLFILCETSLENLLISIDNLVPDIIIIDSVQTLHTDKLDSSPGTISQIKECTNAVLQYAKNKSVPVFLIGHITKEGSLAGPKVLEHIVDTVLVFEGDINHMYRILRASKNRFGSTSELGIFEMQSSGLREVENPSELLISHRNEGVSGTAIASTMSGNRPLLIEVQALVSTAAYGTPQRSSTGFDLRRLNMMLAVLEKRAGFRLAAKDVFLNIAGGLKIDDPGIDLAVICAILSSDQDMPTDNTACFAAEIGLTGEIRPVNRIEQRIMEAEKLGFDRIFISKFNAKGLDCSKTKIKIEWVTRVDDVFRRLFG